MSAAARLPWLRTRIVRNVLLPLAAVWFIGSTVVIGISSYFAAAAFDRALLDDALGLVASVTLADGELRVGLTFDELHAVLFDQSEAVHYALRLADGRLVAGDNELDAPRRSPTQPYEFVDTVLRDEPLRAVVLRREQPLPFQLVLAQTTHYRGALLRRLLLYSMVPQALLLLLLGAWLRRAIQADVQPIVALQDELNRRGVAELHPLASRASTRDLQSLTRSIDALMARLADTLRLQREFSGNVAHELRTPLAAIGALAEYGLARDEPALWREQLQGIAHSQARASHLIDQLLALALADESGGRATLHEVVLDELVRRVLLRTMPRADAAAVDLGAHGLDETVNVLGDEALIEGALQNLLDNALRYGRPAAAQLPTVTVSLLRDAATVVLAVIDNGPGIPDAERAALLERWQQGREGRRLGQGAGLGLSIVSRYARLMSATLSIEAGPQGVGTCVLLVFNTP